VYSAKINGEATTFGTSGLLYRSNKVMYDRLTNSLWRQFTGEPVVGPLADSGIMLPFFPVELTTWGEWVAQHPDTTVLSLDTGVYSADSYENESDPRATYNDYFADPETRFPVWNRSDALATKAVVLGLSLGGENRAYALETLHRERVVNDTLGGTEVVVIGSTISQAARVYRRAGNRFSFGGDAPTPGGLPTSLVDGDGATWRVTEDFLQSGADPGQRLERVPAHTSFWFGWFAFHTDTTVYGQDGG
jgi:hypothetical protein